MATCRLKKVMFSCRFSSVLFILKCFRFPYRNVKYRKAWCFSSLHQWNFLWTRLHLIQATPSWLQKTLWMLMIHQINALFNPEISFLAAKALNGPQFHWKSYFFTKLIDSHKIRHKTVQYFNLLHAHKPKFGLFLPVFFLALFLSYFSLLLLSLPFTFHILYGCCKQLGVDQGQSLEMGPWSVIGLMGHFTTIFTRKLITLTFKLLHHNAIKIRKRVLCR